MEPEFDVIVVGASLAGCTAARLYAQQGLTVVLIDHQRDPAAYKRFCSHYIQASAVPILRRLGLDSLIEQAGGLRNGTEVSTPFGLIAHHAPTDAGGAALHGYNIQRRTLDPMLRSLTCATPGVTPFFGYSVRDLIIEQEQVRGIRLEGARATTLRAQLVVAADGRSSGIARLLGVTAKEAENSRFGILCSYKDAVRKRGTCSQMWLNGAEAAYFFPNDGDVSVVLYMNAKEQLPGAAANPAAMLECRMASLQNGPELRGLQRLSEPLLIKKFNNQWRAPVTRGVCFVGDALMSLDYFWGTGCGFSLQQAAWLVDATSAALGARKGLDAARRQYAGQVRRGHGLHRILINDFSRRHHLNWLERMMFTAATRDARCAQHVHAFGARLITPMQFISPGALFRAAWVNVTQPGAVPAAL